MTPNALTEKGTAALGLILCSIALPVLAIFGGATNILNWGPGLCVTAAAVFCTACGSNMRRPWGGGLHTMVFLVAMLLLGFRAVASPALSESAHDLTLLAFASLGYLLAKGASPAQTRALMSGLSLLALTNAGCVVVQMFHPGWNLIYPDSTQGHPTGVFAHYNHSAAFGLIATGLLIAQAWKEPSPLRFFHLLGLSGALASIALSLSRGGGFALGVIAVLALSILLMRAFRNSNYSWISWLPAVVIVVGVLDVAKFVIPMVGGHRGMDTGGALNDGGRISFYDAAWKIAIENPLLGGGSRCFSWNVFHQIDGLTSEPDMVHNEALQLLVDYGFPALFIVSILLIWPIGRALWDFTTKREPTGAAWEAIGLVGLLAQSNFDFVFHNAVTTTLAGIALGRISHGLWRLNGHRASRRNREDARGALSLDNFLIPAKSHASAFLAGHEASQSALIELLRQAKDEVWLELSYDLLYWTKVGSSDGLRRSIMTIEAKCTEAIEMAKSQSEAAESPGQSETLSRGWAWLRSVGLLSVAIPSLIFGVCLTRALADAWVSMWHPTRLSNADRFFRLFRLLESNPYLGIDREVLGAAIARIYEFQTQEGREVWAQALKVPLLNVGTKWNHDTGVALQLANIFGWAGDESGALGMYDHAISLQGGNESLFMARSFKGEYLYEIAVSAREMGERAKQENYAQLALNSWQEARNELVRTSKPFGRSFSNMMVDCQSMVASSAGKMDGSSNK